MAANTTGFSLQYPRSLSSSSTHTSFIQMTPREQEAELTQGKILAGNNSTNLISSLMPWSIQQLGGQLYCRWNGGQPWSRTNLSEHTVPERSHGKHSLPTLDHRAEVEGTEVMASTEPTGYCKCICECQVLQSCRTLFDPMVYNPPGSPVRGILQARILEWVAMLSSTESSRPRDRTPISHASCTGGCVLCDRCHLGSPIWVVSYGICLSVSLTSLSVIVSRSIHVAASGIKVK